MARYQNGSVRIEDTLRRKASRAQGIARLGSDYRSEGEGCVGRSGSPTLQGKRQPISALPWEPDDVWAALPALHSK